MARQFIYHMRGRCHVIENWTRLRRNLQLQSRRDDFTPRLQGRCPEDSVRSAEVRWRWTLKVFSLDDGARVGGERRLRRR